MTEVEAKTKWCPFARPVDLGRGMYVAGERAVIRTDDGASFKSIGDRCIGSACMAWRWGRVDEPDGKHGCCGLVGKPVP